MIFCDVVGDFVVFTLGPVYSKLVLVMESHINGLGAFAADVSVGKPDHCPIVDFKVCVFGGV